MNGRRVGRGAHVAAEGVIAERIQRAIAAAKIGGRAVHDGFRFDEGQLLDVQELSVTGFVPAFRTVSHFAITGRPS